MIEDKSLSKLLTYEYPLVKVPYKYYACERLVDYDSLGRGRSRELRFFKRSLFTSMFNMETMNYKKINERLAQIEEQRANNEMLSFIFALGREMR